MEIKVLLELLVCRTWATLEKTYGIEGGCGKRTERLYLEPSRSAQSWSSSAELCKAGGGKLPEIKSREMQTCLEDFARRVSLVTPFFIDLGRQNLGSTSYESVAGKDNTQNVTGNTEENFLKVFSGDIQPVSSSIPISFVCKFNNSARCIDCIRSRGNYYQANKIQTDWYSARNHCLENGGDLIDFDDVKSMNGTELGYSEYSLGHSRIKWVWSDEKEFTRYTNWHGGYENTSFDDAKKCVVVSSSKDYKWEAAECDSDLEMAVVCMRNISTEMIPACLTEVYFYVSLALFAIGVAGISASVIHLIVNLVRRKRNMASLRAPEARGKREQQEDDMTYMTLSDSTEVGNVYIEMQPRGGNESQKKRETTTTTRS